MITPTQRTALTAHLAAAKRAKATLNGDTVEQVFDAFEDRVPEWLTAAASEASHGLSVLIAQIEGHLLVNREQ